MVTHSTHMALKQDVHAAQGSLVIIVFGASGDLAKKKTFPALFNLYRRGFLPKHTSIVGYARTDMTREKFLSHVIHSVASGHEEEFEAFASITSYFSGQYDDDASFKALNEYIEQLESQHNVGAREQRHRLFYLALPPSVFVPVARGIKHHVYTSQGPNRVVIEKPFGRDTESSAELGKEIGSLFTEHEIYRIDHYLGKDMVKNIIRVRFANILFSNIWDRKYIDNVQITLKEPFGTEGRGGYFDDFGIIRDVMQNHLLQVLTLIAMERPVSTDPEAVRDEKVKVLRCIPPITPKDALVGQYVAANDKPGYLDDATLKNKQSHTPTFAALTLWIENERWQGVPFIMKAGKALDEAKVEVRIQFHNEAANLFGGTSRNELVLRIQPSEAMYIKFNNKQPGLSTDTIQTDLDLTYRDRYVDLSIPDAYESLLLDVLRNDQSNFVRDDELDAAWRIFTPLLHQVDRNDPAVKFTTYPYGSRGPTELTDFMERFGYERSDSLYAWPKQSAATRASI